jgi:hypothetical protein
MMRELKSDMGNITSVESLLIKLTTTLDYRLSKCPKIERNCDAAERKALLDYGRNRYPHTFILRRGDSPHPMSSIMVTYTY